MRSPISLLRKIVNCELSIVNYELLIVNVGIILLTLTPLNDIIPTLSIDNPWSRLTYSFRHANILHAGINAFVFYQIVRNFRISAARLAVAYLIAVLVPPMFITAPAVGLSVIIYALFGLIVPFVATAKRKQYITSVLVFIIPQVIIPHFAWHLHIYAFLTALLLIIPSLKE